MEMVLSVSDERKAIPEGLNPLGRGQTRSFIH